MLRVVVTGAAGYLGSVLCSKLLRAGHAVRAFDNLLHGGLPLLSLIGQENFEFIRGDIRDSMAVAAALDRATVLVHLAAIVGDPACAHDPDTALVVNHEASLDLIAAAVRSRVERFIFASTCSNYGRMSDTSVLAKEDHMLRPVSLYAKTKVAVEQALLAASQSGFHPTILRFATLYGLSPRMRFDLTVNQFAMEMQTNGHLVVFGEQFWRPYVHVRDAAQGILDCLDAPEERVGGEIFNIGTTPENFRKQDLVDLIQARLRQPARVERVTKVEDLRDYRVSFDKAARTLRFTARNTVRSGIDEIISALEAGIIPNPTDTGYCNVR